MSCQMLSYSKIWKATYVLTSKDASPSNQTIHSHFSSSFLLLLICCSFLECVNIGYIYICIYLYLCLCYSLLLSVFSTMLCLSVWGAFHTKKYSNNTNYYENFNTNISINSRSKTVFSASKKERRDNKKL